MADFMNLGIFLKLYREKSGFTQIALADALGNVHSQFVSNWERGLCAPPSHCLESLFKILKIDREKMVEVMVIDARTSIESKILKKKRLNKK